MTLVRHYPMTKSNVTKEPSWFVLIMISGIISGLLLFIIGWYLSLPDIHKGVVVKKILSAGEIFPGIVGLNKSKVLLVMGVDMPPKNSNDDYHAVRTDTIMLVKIDTFRKKVNIVSIPRDSKVFLANNNGVNKINSAFAIGGADLAIATVEQTFGVDIDNYIVANIRGVREFVDALGGIDIFVEKPMQYRDRTAGLNINLHTGQQHLDGKQAEGFLRFRHDALGDIGRIRRQQQFLAAIAKKIKDPSVLLAIKPLITASNKYVLTDMPTTEMLSMVLFGKDLESSSFNVATLPGHPSLSSQVSYWIIDPAPAEMVLNRLILGVSNYGDDLSANIPTLGILYTGSHAGEISDYQQYLESKGFKVTCKLRLHRSNTKLITHSAGFDRATEEKLKQSNLALKDAQLIFSPHGATFETNSCGRTNFTVVLGEDTRSAVEQ